MFKYNKKVDLILKILKKNIGTSNHQVTERRK